MAVYKGKAAAVKKNTVAVSLAAEWTIEATLDTEEITDFGDSWAAHAANIARWSGSMTVFFDPSNTEQKAIHDALITATPTGALTDMTFYLDGSNYYSGNIIVTGIPITVRVGEIIKATFNFMGNGALTYN